MVSMRQTIVILTITAYETSLQTALGLKEIQGFNEY